MDKRIETLAAVGSAGETAPLATKNLYQLASTQLIKSLRSVQELEPNGYLERIEGAEDIQEFYEFALDLDRAACSKELRDTGDDRVHELLEAIHHHIRILDSIFRMKLLPYAREQLLEWKQSAARDMRAKHAFRDDTSLEISLLDASIQGSRLHVRRVWSHVSNYGGSWTDFNIRLDADQMVEFRRKVAALSQLQFPFDE